MIRSGAFGWADIFAPLCDGVDGIGNDAYLLANDFPSYLQAQVRPGECNACGGRRGGRGVRATHCVV